MGQNQLNIEYFTGGVTLYLGDCLERLKEIASASVDSCVTDPPYHLTTNKKGGTGVASVNLESPYGRARIGTGNGAGGFMGKAWDGGDIAFRVELWAEVLRVLKPGGHLLAFSGTRTYHRMACAIKDAGFEIRDQIGWAFGQGFPKSLDVSKAIDKAAGATREVLGRDPNWRGRCHTDAVYNGGQSRPEFLSAPASPAAREWEGWGTALKPAWEPICVGRKPLIGTVADNVLKHGTGAINIDGCRVELNQCDSRDVGRAIDRNVRNEDDGYGMNSNHAQIISVLKPEGRFPANVVHDGSPDVLAAFPDNLSSGTGAIKNATGAGTQANAYGKESRPAGTANIEYGDTGSAARFFYTAKADSEDRLGSKHPTVKPVDLMQWLVRLVTPKGGIVLDPFAGTGTTGEASIREGMHCLLIEQEAEYQDDIRRRMKLALSGPDERARESIKAKLKDKPIDAGPLFGSVEAAE